MKKVLERMSVSADRVSQVPKSDTDRLKTAVRDRAAQKIEARAKEQRVLVNKVRAHPVR